MTDLLFACIENGSEWLRIVEIAVSVGFGISFVRARARAQRTSVQTAELRCRSADFFPGRLYCMHVHCSQIIASCVVRTYAHSDDAQWNPVGRRDHVSFIFWYVCAVNVREGSSRVNFRCESAIYFLSGRTRAMLIMTSYRVWEIAKLGSKSYLQSKRIQCFGLTSGNTICSEVRLLANGQWWAKSVTFSILLKTTDFSWNRFQTISQSHCPQSHDKFQLDSIISLCGDQFVRLMPDWNYVSYGFRLFKQSDQIREH